MRVPLSAFLQIVRAGNLQSQSDAACDLGVNLRTYRSWETTSRLVDPYGQDENGVTLVARLATWSGLQYVEVEVCLGLIPRAYTPVTIDRAAFVAELFHLTPKPFLLEVRRDGRLDDPLCARWSAVTLSIQTFHEARARVVALALEFPNSDWTLELNGSEVFAIDREESKPD